MPINNVRTILDPNKEYYIECCTIKNRNTKPLLIWSVETDGIVQTQIIGGVDTPVSNTLQTTKRYTIRNATFINLIYAYSSMIGVSSIDIPVPIEIK